MQSVDREISISITKIFNWPDSKPNASFELEFFSQKTASSIIKKTVKADFYSNAIILNSLLKVTYTDDESVITMNLVQLHQEKKQLLGQFQIDLNALKKKNIQYFPFGQDKVLQVNLFGGKQMNESRNFYNREEDNENFIREKESFIEKKIHRGDQKIKKSFSEKVLNLLREVQDIKGSKDQVNKYKFPSHCGRKEDDYQPTDTMAKSVSEKRFKPYSFRSEVDREEKRVGRPQKHKLILNTLNVVPSDEYFSRQVGQTRESRGYGLNYNKEVNVRHKLYNGY